MTEAERLRKMADGMTFDYTAQERSGYKDCECQACDAGCDGDYCPACLRLAATACVRLAETLENGVTR